MTRHSGPRIAGPAELLFAVALICAVVAFFVLYALPDA